MGYIHRRCTLNTRHSSAKTTVREQIGRCASPLRASRDLSGEPLVFGGKRGRSRDARCRPDDRGCCRRDGFSDGYPGGHTGTRIGADVIATLIETHSQGADRDKGACSDRAINRNVLPLASFPVL
jgi:hypothetical protein